MLKDAGLCIVELGHDGSELPLVGVLNNSLTEIGIAENDIICIKQDDN